MPGNDRREKAMIVSIFDNMASVLLAGGLGTRLRSVVADRQKAVAGVCGKPFLRFLLMQLEKAGISEKIIACGYGFESVKDALPERPDLKYSVESGPLGTGGALRLALSATSAEFILAMNGDSFLGLDFLSFLRAFEQSKKPVMMALTRTDDVSRYGRAVLENGLVREFHEKGTDSGEGWINAGIYVFRREILEKYSVGVTLSLEQEVFPALALAENLAGFVCDGPFIDIGTPDSYKKAQTFLKGMDVL